ncbi:uncharacterized protein VP01_4215g1, partial [Puccinia sorghi]
MAQIELTSQGNRTDDQGHQFQLLHSQDCPQETQHQDSRSPGSQRLANIHPQRNPNWLNEGSQCGNFHKMKLAKEEAIGRMNLQINSQSPIKTSALKYTNGSYDREKGAGAAICLEADIALSLALGVNPHILNHECEAVGVLLELQLLRRRMQQSPCASAFILTDNKGVQRLEDYHQAKTGQYLFMEIAEAWRSLPEDMEFNLNTASQLSQNDLNLPTGLPGPLLADQPTFGGALTPPLLSFQGQTMTGSSYRHSRRVLIRQAKEADLKFNSNRPHLSLRLPRAHRLVASFLKSTGPAGWYRMQQMTQWSDSSRHTLGSTRRHQPSVRAHHLVRASFTPQRNSLMNKVMATTTACVGHRDCFNVAGLEAHRRDCHRAVPQGQESHWTSVEQRREIVASRYLGLEIFRYDMRAVSDVRCKVGLQPFSLQVLCRKISGKSGYLATILCAHVEREISRDKDIHRNRNPVVLKRTTLEWKGLQPVQTSVKNSMKCQYGFYSPESTHLSQHEEWNRKSPVVGPLAVRASESLCRLNRIGFRQTLKLANLTHQEMVDCTGGRTCHRRNELYNWEMNEDDDKEEEEFNIFKELCSDDELEKEKGKSEKGRRPNKEQDQQQATISSWRINQHMTTEISSGGSDFERNFFCG